MTSKLTYKSGLRNECVHLRSKSAIETDAPVDNNGQGQKFSPTDLVATGLAACMITVMGIRADKSDIPFENISATVNKLMASDPRKIGAVEVVITIADKWTDQQKELLEKVGLNCPVALSLHPDLEQKISFVYT